jgi:hypothetical protein
VTLSFLEDAFLDLLAAHQLPRPRTKQDVARRRRSSHIAYTYGDVTRRAGATAQELRTLLTRT